MKFIFIIFLSMFLNNCNYAVQDTLDIGKSLPNNINLVDTSLHLVLYKPNEFRPGKLITYKNIVYSVYLDTQKLVKFISTSDANFRSPEDFRIGESYKKIKQKIKQEFYVPGFSYEAVLSSGWHAAFLDDFILNTGTISDTSKIRTFFKRDEK